MRMGTNIERESHKMCTIMTYSLHNRCSLLPLHRLLREERPKETRFLFLELDIQILVVVDLTWGQFACLRVGLRWGRFVRVEPFSYKGHGLDDIRWMPLTEAKNVPCVRQ